MFVVSLVYVSSAVREFSEQDLIALLKKCGINNPNKRITGMLLYKDGNFMQVLEGPEEVGEAVFAKIKRDQRHSSILRLCTRTIDEREFPDWPMGFHNLSNAKLSNPKLCDIPGYSEFMNVPLDSDYFVVNSGMAIRLLSSFRNSLVRF